MLDEDLAIVNALREENMYFTDNEEHYPSDDDDYNDFLQPVNIDKQIRDERIGIANYLNDISNGFTLEEDTGIVHNIRNHGHQIKVNLRYLKSKCSGLELLEEVDLPVPYDLNILEIFDALVFPDFWNVVTTETNRYTLQEIARTDPNSEAQRTSIPEMKCFIAILIRMAKLKISSIRDQKATYIKVFSYLQ